MGTEGGLDAPAGVGQDQLAEGLRFRGRRRGGLERLAHCGDSRPDRGDDDPAGRRGGRPACFRRLKQSFHRRDFPQQFM